MAEIGERMKGLLRGENPAAEGSAKVPVESGAMNKGRTGFVTPTVTFEDCCDLQNVSDEVTNPVALREGQLQEDGPETQDLQMDMKALSLNDDFRPFIFELLQGLPRPLRLAYSARCAAMALPVLTSQEDLVFLEFWTEEKREWHLLGVLRSVLSAYCFSATDIKVEVASYTAVNDASYNPESVRAIVAARSAFLADQAIHATLNSAISANVALAASFAALANRNLLPVLFQEAESLRPDTNILAYLTQPLPDFIKPQARYFISQLNQFGSGFDWWAGWYQEILDGGPLNLELLKQCQNVPNELLEQGPASVNAYLKSITRHEATQPLNRIRLIFLGYGQSGKTSLLRALHGEDVVAGEGDMTPGIEIREWPVPESDIMAHVWDFGGQVMAHATHQFFLRESCVYVLVMEPRAEINANQQAQYWLEHVRLFGKDAPVLLVGNKADLPLALHLDMNTLTDSYRNIVGFFPLSCTGYRDQYRHQFEIFRDALAVALRQAGTHQLLFTPRHFAVLEALRDWPKDQAFLPKPDYEALCERHEVAAEGELDRSWLLDLLDKLGEVVHFLGIAWYDAYVLNPRWLTYGVYTLLYSEEARSAAGRLTQAQVIAILGRGGCPDNAGNPLAFSAVQSRFILDAMQRFELCYALPEAADTFILPDLLPSDRPDELGFDKNQALAFDLDFAALLPRHLMTSFIVRRHAEIVDQRVWQNGVVLASHNWQAEALVQADHHRRRLSLWVTGKDAARYFTTLHDEFMSMIKRLKMDRSQFSEWVVLLPSAVQGGETIRAKFRNLLAEERAGRTHHVCDEGTFELAEVLKIMPKDEREKQSREIHFHGPGVYQENGHMSDVTLGNKTVILSQVKDMDKKLADLHYEIGVQVEDEALRGKALRELEMIRQALQKIEKGEPEDKQTALDTLSRFGDKLKEGTGGTVEALKSLKDGGEAVTWLIEQAPVIIAALGAWLG